MKGYTVYGIGKYTAHDWSTVYNVLKHSPKTSRVLNDRVADDERTVEYHKNISFGAKHIPYYTNEEDIDQFTNLRFKWN